MWSAWYDPDSDECGWTFWKTNFHVPSKVPSTKENGVQPRIQVNPKLRLRTLDQTGSSSCFELAIGAQVVAGVRMVRAIGAQIVAGIRLVSAIGAVLSSVRAAGYEGTTCYTTCWWSAPATTASYSMACPQSSPSVPLDSHHCALEAHVWFIGLTRMSRRSKFNCVRPVQPYEALLR